MATRRGLYPVTTDCQSLNVKCKGRVFLMGFIFILMGFVFLKCYTYIYTYGYIFFKCYLYGFCIS